MTRFNLMPPARMHRVMRRRRSYQWAGTVALALFGAVGAVIASSTQVRSSPWSRLDADIARARSLADAARAEARESELAYAQAQRRIEAARAVGEHPDWSLLLRLLAVLRGDSAVIESITIAPADTADRTSAAGSAAVPARTPAPWAYSVRMSGIAPSAWAVTQFALRLEDSRVFARVQQGDIQPRTVRGTDVRWFRIEASLAPGGGDR
jgi:hypothetical protein